MKVENFIDSQMVELKDGIGEIEAQLYYADNGCYELRMDYDWWDEDVLEKRDESDADKEWMAGEVWDICEKMNGIYANIKLVNETLKYYCSEYVDFKE